jgi:putative transposase
VRDQFLVEISDTTSQQIAEQGLDHTGGLLELNRLFTAWVEVDYHRRVHTETGQTPLERWEASWATAGKVPAIPDPADLTEAFLWSTWRRVTKTATVSLHNNLYQVDAVLAGRKVELVFDPFDLSRIEVRYDQCSYGSAAPQAIGHHVHPKARPKTPTPQGTTPTGINYAELTAEIHHRQLHDAERINYTNLVDAAGTTGEQLPGQLSILDALNTENTENTEGSMR